MPKRTPAEFKSLDGLRGIFALVVMIGHFCLFQSHFQADTFKNVALCVQFFFILSGFALSFGFLDKFRFGSVTLGSFGWQRFVRLYPMHIVSIVFFVPSLMGTLTGSGNLAWDTVLNLFLLQCIGLTHSWSWNLASWSISTEFWVGLAVLPIACKMLSARQAITLSILGYAVLLVLLGTVRTQYAFVLPGLLSAVLSTASGLLMGAALFRWARVTHFHLEMIPAVRVMVGCVEAVLLAAIIYIASLAIHGKIEFVCIAAMPFLIYSVSVSRSWTSSLLSSKPLLWLGCISYSLYLLHIPVLGALMFAGLDRIESVLGRFVIFATVTAGGSYLAYRFIEMPIYKRWRKPSPGAVGRGQNQEDRSV